MPGTFDFFGLNFYTGVYGQSGKEGPTPSMARDSGCVTTRGPPWPSSASSWLSVSNILCEILGSHGSDYEDCLLECCAELSGTSLPTFQRCLLPRSSQR
jgi:hypothetical protein